MHSTIITDASCLIILSKINELQLLKEIYTKICTTPTIAAEFGDPLPQWIEICKLHDNTKQKLLELYLDKGESSAIALAMEIPKSILMIDDHKARQVAKYLGLVYTGTIGVIIKAKIKGIIPSIKPLIDKIKATNFYISKELEEIAIKEAKE
ncbi:MAG: DUF3368 domain-containing protein [Leptonema sp. (in: Bacteria)]|nr:DUF3368 domain-containing protein [Leptonema sp. (in: bacteria)]